MIGSKGLGGYCLRLNIYLHMFKVLPGIHLNTWIYNVCRIKHDTKVLSPYQEISK